MRASSSASRRFRAANSSNPGWSRPGEGQERRALLTSIDGDGHLIGPTGLCISLVVKDGNNAGQGAVWKWGVELKNSPFMGEGHARGHTRRFGRHLQLIGHILAEALAGAFERSKKR